MLTDSQGEANRHSDATFSWESVLSFYWTSKVLSCCHSNHLVTFQDCPTVNQQRTGVQTEVITKWVTVFIRVYFDQVNKLSISAPSRIWGFIQLKSFWTLLIIPSIDRNWPAKLRYLSLGNYSLRFRKILATLKLLDHTK